MDPENLLLLKRLVLDSKCISRWARLIAAKPSWKIGNKVRFRLSKYFDKLYFQTRCNYLGPSINAKKLCRRRRPHRKLPPIR